MGGMSEFVKHEENGLLFDFREEESLAIQMQRLLDNPELAKKLGERRYLHTSMGDIPDIQDHVQKIEKVYLDLLVKKGRNPQL